ncbi:hypothetical protein QFC19_008026 [Naganishia cerealis]|uniref:Uncharacterized protein n=1 Tax=Naganishia cerealis TaxID=610337 RepID=A0ACC2V561_9TREE|nr:hypothetical protein QFC19_008026 [Naganishia cerealis]
MDSTLGTQEIGMIKAKHREETRKAARLIYHFGFRHFIPAGQTVNGDYGVSSSLPKRTDGKRDEQTALRLQQNAEVEAVQDGKVIQDVTHAKGEWGLRYKRE